MRIPRIRLRLRTLLLLIATVAILLAGVRVYRDGFMTHWLILKLEFGNVQARRSALGEIDRMGLLPSRPRAAGRVGPTSAAEQAAIAEWQFRKRRARVFLPALLRVLDDPDPDCRDHALSVVSLLAGFEIPEAKPQVLPMILDRVRDRDERVRSRAIVVLGGLADAELYRDQLRAGLDDSAIAVRERAAYLLGFLPSDRPDVQGDVVPALVELLASPEEVRVKASAAWALARLGADSSRHPSGSGPDVVPALLSALDDPEVELRRAAAKIFGMNRLPGPAIGSDWSQRERAIVPRLLRALSDEDRTVRENAALALFFFGRRDRKVVSMIEEGSRNLDHPDQSRLNVALKQWRRELDDPEFLGWLSGEFGHAP